MKTQIISYKAKNKKELIRVEGLLIGLGISYNTEITYTGTKPNKVKRVEFEILEGIRK